MYVVHGVLEGGHGNRSYQMLSNDDFEMIDGLTLHLVGILSHNYNCQNNKCFSKRNH